MVFARGDEIVEDGEVVPGVLVTKEEVVDSTECCATQGSLGGVVVEGNRGVTQKAAERAMIFENVADRAAQRRTRPMAAAMLPTPAQEFHEERLRFTLSQCEMLIGSVDVFRLHSGLDPIQLRDEIEGFLRLGVLALQVALPAYVSEAAGSFTAPGLGQLL